MARNYDQTKKYQVTFNTAEFKPEVWEFIMGKHPTQYGNGSSVAIFVNEAFRDMCDTRYDLDIMNDFGKWCKEFLNAWFDPKYEPVITEIAEA